MLSDSGDAKITRRKFLTGAALAVTAGAAGGGVWLLSRRAILSNQTGDASQKPTLYLVATAHTDTQWNWTVQSTIRDFIPRTMRPNWELFEKYPEYDFNYEGVIHYMFFKEYHPEDWPELQAWVRKGRWKLSGSWINAVDVCNPSPESLFRQALYGQQFFRREFGQVSRDVFLPDCFGFPYSLPTIARHSGLIAFSTQKLTWGCWTKIPFSVGRWIGVDGSEVAAALRCGAYGLKIADDVATDASWTNDFSSAGDRKVNLRYFGTGDTGGTPGQWTAERAQMSVLDRDAPVRVLNTSADHLAKTLTPAETAALPHYQGELVMSTHGVGCYTSQAARKKWNRQNEHMADAAETAALAAAWLGGPAYPQEMLTQAWIRFLWHQFHDDLPGTCIPQAYTFSWNDDLLSLSQFSRVLTTSVGAVAQHLDTRAEGAPLIVYNVLSEPRTDVVETTVTLPQASSCVRVYDPATGKEVPSQVLSQSGANVTLLILATLPSVGFKVYDVRPSAQPCALKTKLTATSNGLESERYLIAVDSAGDLSRVYDKKANIEMLRVPSQLQHFHDVSSGFPAWQIMWETVSVPPGGTVAGNPHVHVSESGPVRVALEITRTLGDSTFVQSIRLTAKGDWVEVHNDVDWRTPGTLIKAAFPMTASNPNATYDIGLGTIERPNADAHRYEVNAQQWADITDASGSHGLAILTNYKYGWDKPSDTLLRLTLLRTPSIGDGFPHQQTNDIGHHRFDYALAAHAGDWRIGGVPQKAARFNQPLRAFLTTPHPGPGGHEFSLARVSTDQVAIRALKKAEEGDEWVIRLQELHGKQAQATVAFIAPLLSAREINAAEEPIGAYQTQDGKLAVDLTPYQPRSFAVRLAAAPHRIAPPVSAPVALPYDLDGVSLHADFGNGAFDASGQTYPGELWPSSLISDGIAFSLGSSASGAMNILTCRGQTITLPEGDHNRLYLLAASIDGDQSGVFTVHVNNSQTHQATLDIHDWAEHIGQWDSRLAHPSHGDGGSQVVKDVKNGKVVDLDKMQPAYVKRASVAWVGTHRHGIDGDQPYLFCYLFKYGLDLPPGASSLTLPDDPRIRVMAMAAAKSALDNTIPAGVLFESELTSATLPKARAARLSDTAKIVFSLSAPQTFGATDYNIVSTEAPHLPIHPDDTWTITLSVLMDTQPADGTLIGGFGDDQEDNFLTRYDMTDLLCPRGARRYLGKSASGICLFGGGFAIETRTPYDLGKWQTITATYDGVTVTIYKNGRTIGSGRALFNAAEATAKLAPHGASLDGPRFTGTIKGFTVWDGALPPAVTPSKPLPLLQGGGWNGVIPRTARRPNQ